VNSTPTEVHVNKNRPLLFDGRGLLSGSFVIVFSFAGGWFPSTSNAQMRSFGSPHRFYRCIHRRVTQPCSRSSPWRFSLVKRQRHKRRRPTHFARLQYPAVSFDHPIHIMLLIPHYDGFVKVLKDRLLQGSPIQIPLLAPWRRSPPDPGRGVWLHKGQHRRRATLLFHSWHAPGKARPPMKA
jgi:hypothetical protein